VGTKWKSALIELGLVFHQHHANTARFQHGRLLLTACSHPAIAEDDLARDLAGSSTAHAAVVRGCEAQAHGCRVGFPATPAASESMNGTSDAVATEAPDVVAPLPSVTEPAPSRLCVPAATVVSHGPAVRHRRGRRAAVARGGRDEYAGVGANRKAISTGRGKLVREPPDREVDHIHAVGHGLVDRCDAVAVETGAAGSCLQHTL